MLFVDCDCMVVVYCFVECGCEVSGYVWLVVVGGGV